MRCEGGKVAAKNTRNERITGSGNRAAGASSARRWSSRDLLKSVSRSLRLLYPAMSFADPRRVQLQPAYVLHHRPYRDTSRILELFTRDQGRVSVFARGARGARKGGASLVAILQPFNRLLVSWSGARRSRAD